MFHVNVSFCTLFNKCDGDRCTVNIIYYIYCKAYVYAYMSESPKKDQKKNYLRGYCSAIKLGLDIGLNQFGKSGIKIAKSKALHEKPSLRPLRSRIRRATWLRKRLPLRKRSVQLLRFSIGLRLNCEGRSDCKRLKPELRCFCAKPPFCTAFRERRTGGGESCSSRTLPTAVRIRPPVGDAVRRPS